MTQQRLNYFAVAPKAREPLLALEAYIKQSSLEPLLIDLVKTRASQINGCAYCLHMHTSDAVAQGENPARLFLLEAWEESAMYSPRERAALAWTEALTRLHDETDLGPLRAELRNHFSERDIGLLTCEVAMINFWNRFGVARH